MNSPAGRVKCLFVICPEIYICKAVKCVDPGHRVVSLSLRQDAGCMQSCRGSRWRLAPPQSLRNFVPGSARSFYCFNCCVLWCSVEIIKDVIQHLSAALSFSKVRLGSQTPGGSRITCVTVNRATQHVIYWQPTKAAVSLLFATQGIIEEWLPPTPT